jgi:putative DNA methylase
MLLGLLLPDPCDPHCPENFKSKARELLPKVQGKVGPNDKDLQQALLKFIGDFSNWDLSSNQTYLEVGRGLVKAAHPEETPLVVDPFAGGGSIPLEALRLGCETFASDLNPVACLILKVMLEDIPRYGLDLAEELRRVGKEIKEAAEKELAGLYPVNPDGSKPIAYLWARTVRCEAPNCGAEIPLVRSFWLCKKANRKKALRHNILRPEKQTPQVEFEIFEPQDESEVRTGTVTRAKATCLCCGTVLPPERVRSQLVTQRGGGDVVFDEKDNRIGGARLLAVVTLKQGEQGRHYRPPTQQDYEVTRKAQNMLKEIVDEWERNGRKGLCPIPDEPTPAGGGSGAGRAFSVQRYGMMTFSDLFTARQKSFLSNIQSQIAARELQSDGDALLESFGMVLGRVATYGTTSGWWHRPGEKMGPIFGRPALPVVWDFAEVNPFVNATGGYQGALQWVTRVVEKTATSHLSPGQVSQEDACYSPLPNESVGVWFTDPPYYDAIPYSDLSDFFYVLLRRWIPGHPLMSNPFEQNSVLTPKCPEIVQDEIKRSDDGRWKDRSFFEDRMSGAFAEGRRILRPEGIGSVVFAHKTTEGWEALIGGLIQGGWVITGSWPITTEMQVRLRAKESAALSASVHMVCRPRPEDAPVGDWGEVLRELPKRVGDWMERLQSEGIRGADLVFACIGPALEIYSRYSKVVDAEEREIPLGGDPEATEPHRKGFLAYVWEVVGRTALEQVLGTADLPTPRLRQAGAKDRNSTGGLPAGVLT